MTMVDGREEWVGRGFRKLSWSTFVAIGFDRVLVAFLWIRYDGRHGY